MIPYGSYPPDNADPEVVRGLGLEPSRYALVVARAEPENSILEIVQAFSRKARGARLAIVGLGKIGQRSYEYEVCRAAGPEVVLLGPIYDSKQLAALRTFALFYVHGHRVGGTNPSLVEALGAGCPVLAHDNVFNRWVAGPDARYFDGVDSCEREMLKLLGDPPQIEAMHQSSLARHKSHFQWPKILDSYEKLLLEFLEINRKGTRVPQTSTKGSLSSDK